MNAVLLIIRKTVIGAIRGYRLLLSPVMPKSCRFYPSCSHYAIDAVETHGVIRGAWMAAKRIARCHPWSEPDIDPVPGSKLAAELHHHHHTNA